MADKWITVKPNGADNKGSPALIGEGGEIKAGMGGKFNGDKISEVRKDFTGAKTPKNTSTESNAEKIDALRKKLKETKGLSAKGKILDEINSLRQKNTTEPTLKKPLTAQERERKSEEHEKQQIMQHVGRLYKNASNSDIEKQIKKLDRDIQKQIGLSEGEMSYSGNRSTRKAVSSQAVVTLSRSRQDLEKLLQYRKEDSLIKANKNEGNANPHANDAMSVSVAFDRASARSYDANGHLIVDSTVITKAAVNPYYGKEIPDYESLGLDPEKIYNMLRDPAELEKGMHTLGEKQLLIKHIFVSADDPQKESIAGTIGSNLEMVGNDVKGSLTVWDKEAINLIESGKLAELSASYFYDPVMKSGTFNGQPYDGIMTNIRGNHVALVERGRIGRDALVADALPKLMELNMKLKKGAATKVATVAKAILVAKGLAADADLTPDEIKELITVVAENIEPTAEDTEEAEKLEGAEDEDEEEVAEDADETETADDEDEEAEKAEPEVKKAAMDAAIKQAENKAVQRVTQLFEARELVKPLVGVVAMDSAEAVLKHALKKSGIDSDGVDTVKGLKTLVGLAIKQKSQPQIKTAMDSASYEADPLTDRFK